MENPTKNISKELGNLEHIIFLCKGFIQALYTFRAQVISWIKGR